MARHEGKFLADAARPLAADELLALLDPASPEDGESRRNAIACYLAGGDGWREALGRLGGAFATASAELTDPKGE